MSFEEKLVEWYFANARMLPWRNTKSPYLIWLSEIILQQTRVDQGLNYYNRIITAFPNLENLANSNEEELLKLWQGLGYYHRAKNVLRTAKIIFNELDNVFPRTPSELIKLPGIGAYTACAIAAFAFNYPCQVVDGNVIRVITRFMGIQEDVSKTSTISNIKDNLKSVHQSTKPYDFNQAIMEFGALHCTYLNPKCNSCPLASDCYAFNAGAIDQIPKKSKAVSVKKEKIHYLVFVIEDKILFRKRSMNGIWPGLYDFPELITVNKEKSIENSIRIFCQENGVIVDQIIPEVQKLKHKLSHRLLEISFSIIHASTINFMVEEGQLEYGMIKEKPHPKPITNFLEKNFVNYD